MRPRSLRFHLVLWASIALAPVAHSQETFAPTYSLFGTVGLLDMPTAESAPDAELNLSFTSIQSQLRNTMTFQITPRLSGSFRYSIIDNFKGPGEDGFDRSFDFQYRFVDEDKYRPAIAVGFRDFIGTGRFSSEYFVATKTVSPRLKVTGGIGWGRLGSYNGFSNPLGAISSRFDYRPGRDDEGGTAHPDHWFRGDAAIFAGAEWRATDKLSLKFEYSSDAYANEVNKGLVQHKSPFNFGMNYNVTKNLDVAAFYTYGSDVGIQFSYSFNPKNPPAPSGYDGAPTPVRLRPSKISEPQAWSDGWISKPESRSVLEKNMTTALEREGLELQRFEYTLTSIRLHYRNTTYWSESQALGRAARAITRGLPNTVETFVLVPVVNGMDTTAVTIQRSDIEELENAPDASWRSYVRADIDDAAALDRSRLTEISGVFPRVTWGLGPYMSIGLFDPDAPFRYNIGAELSGSYEPTPGLLFSGSLRKKVVGNLDQVTRVSDSVLPHVRSDYALYDKYGDPEIAYLTGEYFYRPAPDFYTRFSAGLLEPMFAGVSGEVLWKPTQSALAFGMEVNYVKQRDYDQLFGMLDYSVSTGHASAYYTFKNGFYSQFDIGRYLAGDWGGTLSIKRTFGNGWKIGAYATLTDVSSEDFGEGSFDKGITLEIPLFWALGKPSKSGQKILIQPITRDGGARLNLNNRLYDLIANQSEPNLSDQWGRFWR